MSRIALFSLLLILGLLVLGQVSSATAGGLLSADEGVNSFMDQPTVSYPSDHGYQRVNWFVGYDPVYGSCSYNAWNGYCPKKCPGGHGGGRCRGCKR